MQSPRMSTRLWMVAVALLAGFLGVGQTCRKIQIYRERVRQLMEDQNRYIRTAVVAEEGSIPERSRSNEFQRIEASDEVRQLAVRDPELSRAIQRTLRSHILFEAEANLLRDRARWCAAVRLMYERAIWRPWEPSPAEPAFPEPAPSEP